MIIAFVIYFLMTPLLVDDKGVNPDSIEQKYILDAVNAIRETGCYCGRRYMPPVQKVKWNEILYKSALSQADDMYKHDYLKHYSTDGLDIGARLDLVGYNWKVAGENLGRGQETFNQVLKDWLKSYKHCMMLMNPKVDEMAVARVQNYWVQHFGKQASTPSP